MISLLPAALAECVLMTATVLPTSTVTSLIAEDGLALSRTVEEFLFGWGLFGFFFLLLLFRATSAAYGSSQAKSLILARILNALSKARDGTCVLMDISWVCHR